MSYVTGIVDIITLTGPGVFEHPSSSNSVPMGHVVIRISGIGKRAKNDITTTVKVKGQNFNTSINRRITREQEELQHREKGIL